MADSEISRHVVVVLWRERNVLKSVMGVQVSSYNNSVVSQLTFSRHCRHRDRLRSDSGERRKMKSREENNAK